MYAYRKQFLLLDNWGLNEQLLKNNQEETWIDKAEKAQHPLGSLRDSPGRVTSECPYLQSPQVPLSPPPPPPTHTLTLHTHFDRAGRNNSIWCFGLPARLPWYAPSYVAWSLLPQNKGSKLVTRCYHTSMASMPEAGDAPALHASAPHAISACLAPMGLPKLPGT